MSIRILFIILCVNISTIGSADEGGDNDPLEGVNRTVFGFNTTLDEYIIEPVALSYKENIPEIAQLGVSNFFANLEEMPTLFNQILQLKFTSAMDTTMRFLFNSTLGFVGLVDVATEMGFKKRKEDFGQTLGFYGVSSGPYLMLPILGPSSLRDVVIIPVDTMVDVNLNLTTKESLAKDLMFGINIRVKTLPQTTVIYTSNDPYTAMRSSYLQNRDYLIRDGNIDIEDIDF